MTLPALKDIIVGQITNILCGNDDTRFNEALKKYGQTKMKEWALKEWKAVNHPQNRYSIAQANKLKDRIKLFSLLAHKCTYCGAKSDWGSKPVSCPQCGSVQFEDAPN